MIKMRRERRSRRHAVRLDYRPVLARHVPAERDVAAGEFGLGISARFSSQINCLSTFILLLA
jgi:hypothetical protein